MAASRRLRYNLCSATLANSLGNNAGTDTTITFNTALKEGGPNGTNIPTLGAYQYLALRIDNEIVHLTAYTTGATTGTIVRAREATIIATHSAAAVVKNIASKLDAAPLIDDNLWVPTNAGHALDDEFDDAFVDGTWIRVDRSGNSTPLVYTEGSGVMSLKHEGSGDAAQEFHGLMKSISGYSFPITIETCLRFTGQYASNYLMSGLGFSDGTTYAAGKQLFCHGYSNSSNGGGVLLTEYTCNNWNAVTTLGTSYGQSQTAGGRYYLRLQWTAANTFSTWWSGDGVSWIQMQSSAAYTFTPTHAGLIHSHYGGNLKTITTFEYFRVF